MLPVGNKKLSKVMNSDGSDEKRLKLKEKANQNFENYSLLCTYIAIIHCQGKC